MQLQGATRKRFLLRGFALGFLSLLALTPTLHAEAETGEPMRVTCQGDASSFAGSDSMVMEPLKIGLPDDLGIAFEDSVELFRVEIQQRSFGMDQAMLEPKVGPKVLRNFRPNISPPLLV